MTTETNIVFNVGAGALISTIVVIFLGLLAVIWKGKKEIGDTVKEEMAPFRTIGSAITEIQTILRNKFEGVIIEHTLVEKAGSPLRPTKYGAGLIKDSGLEAILDQNKDTLCTKLKASLPTSYTDYDVQEKARTLLINLKDDQMMKPIKEYVYNHPIDIEIILKVGGLWLRDDFLEQPRQISNEEQKSIPFKP